MDASFKMLGLAELNKELKKIPEEFRVKNLASSTRAASVVFVKKAKSNVKKDSGSLESAIRTQKKKSHSKWLSKYQVNINPRRKKSALSLGNGSIYYGHMIEDGTSKMAAQPFMRPAFSSEKENSVRQFSKTLTKKIALSNKKLGRLRK